MSHCCMVSFYTLSVAVFSGCCLLFSIFYYIFIFLNKCFVFVNVFFVCVCLCTRSSGTIVLTAAFSHITVTVCDDRSVKQSFARKMCALGRTLFQQGSGGHSFAAGYQSSAAMVVLWEVPTTQLWTLP